MIVVRVELHSAITGKVSELARMVLCNDGSGSASKGNYYGHTYRGRSTEQLDKREIQRRGQVVEYPRQNIHVWNLVARMLTAMGYK